MAQHMVHINDGSYSKYAEYDLKIIDYEGMISTLNQIKTWISEIKPDCYTTRNAMESCAIVSGQVLGEGLFNQIVKKLDDMIPLIDSLSSFCSTNLEEVRAARKEAVERDNAAKNATNNSNSSNNNTNNNTKTNSNANNKSNNSYMSRETARAKQDRIMGYSSLK